MSSLAKKETLVLWLLAHVALASLFFFLLEPASGDLQFMWLADSFTRGRLDLPHEAVAAMAPTDTVFRDGKFYWPLGPLPAVLFMPLAARFGPSADAQAFAHAGVALLAGLLAYRLARRYAFSVKDSCWLAFAFVYGSVFIGAAFLGGPWHFENELTATLLLAAFLERKGRDRPGLIGALLGLAAATRLTAVIPAGFFFLETLWRKGPVRDKAARLAWLAAPLALSLLLLGAYNEARFHDPFWSGQRDHYLGLDHVARKRAESGVFDPANIPKNFFYYFLNLPKNVGGMPYVDPAGVSVFVLSPVFLWAALARKKKPDFVVGAVVSLASLAVFLSYFRTGFFQFGPRYLTELLPIWFVVLLGVFKERGLTLGPKFTIAASMLANVFMFLSFSLIHLGIT